jgi:hypothetical protein
MDNNNKGLLLLDSGNLFYNVSKKYPGYRINYTNFLKVLPSEIDIVSKIAFGAYKKANTKAMSFTSALSKLNFIIRFKKLNNSKFYNPLIDIVVTTYEHINTCDCFIFGCTNLGLLPLIYKLKDKRKKIYIVGCNISNVFKKYATNTIEINEEFLIDKTDSKHEHIKTTE